MTEEIDTYVVGYGFAVGDFRAGQARWGYVCRQCSETSHNFRVVRGRAVVGTAFSVYAHDLLKVPYSCGMCGKSFMLSKDNTDSIDD